MDKNEGRGCFQRAAILLLVCLPAVWLVVVSVDSMTAAAQGGGPSSITGTPNYLPVIFEPANTPTPTSTNTPVPTLTPTAEPAPNLQDGYYSVDLSGDAGGWIDFRVTSGGTVAYDAAFLYYWYSPPDCGARFWSFSGSKLIAGGQFTFIATDGVSLSAKMECTAVTSTSASCTVQEPDYGGPWLGACGRPVTAIVTRQ